MYTFHEGYGPQESIVVFKDDFRPITADERKALLLRLNRLAGLDNDNVWDDPSTGSRLRVAEMLEDHHEPADCTETLRKLGGAVIRSLVRELAHK